MCIFLFSSPVSRLLIGSWPARELTVLVREQVNGPGLARAFVTSYTLTCI